MLSFEGLIILLFLLWIVGFSFHVGGGMIHGLLILALILLVVRLLRPRTVK